MGGDALHVGLHGGCCSECARTTLHVGVCKAECARLRVPAGGQRFGVAHLPLDVHLLSVQRFAHTQVCKSPYPRANTRLANAQQHRNPGAKLHIHVQVPLAHSHTPTCKHTSVQKAHIHVQAPLARSQQHRNPGAKLQVRVQTALAHLHTRNTTHRSVQKLKFMCKHPLHTHTCAHAHKCAKPPHPLANSPCTLTGADRCATPPTPTCKHPLHTHTHPQVWGGFSR